MKKKNEIVDISFEFALEVIRFSEELNEQKKYLIAKQILASGTSIGANIREAQSSESRLDFIHKLKIAQKEAEETDYWFELCENADNYPNPSFEMRAKLLSIKKLLTKIISTTRSQLK